MTDQELTWLKITDSLSKGKELLISKPLIFRGILTHYEVDTFGRVYSTFNKSYLTQRNSEWGYPTVHLAYGNNKGNAVVHRLVAQTFIPNPDNKPCVNHKDGNKENNHVSNLEWVTHKENTAHAIATGLFDPKNPANHPRGVNHSKAIHTEETIHKVCKLLEQGYGPTEISRMVPEIDLKSVDSIKRKHNWVEISSQYNIPEPKHKKLLNEETRQIIQKLVLDGLKNKDIMKILSFDISDKYIYEQVQWERRKLRNSGQL